MVQSLHTSLWSPTQTPALLAQRLVAMLARPDLRCACEVGWWHPAVLTSPQRWTSFALAGWPEDRGPDRSAGQLPSEVLAAGHVSHIEALVKRCSPGECATQFRDELLSTEEWSAHPLVQSALKPAGFGLDGKSCLLSVYVPPLAGDSVVQSQGIGCIQLFAASDASKGNSAARFHEEDRELVHDIHSTISAWFWHRLGSASPLQELKPEFTEREAGNQVQGEGEHASGSNSVNAAVAALTPAQRAVLPHLLNGDTEAEIARRLFRSRYTVHDHARAIYAALGVRNRIELVLKIRGRFGDRLAAEPGSGDRPNARDR